MINIAAAAAEAAAGWATDQAVNAIFSGPAPTPFDQSQALAVAAAEAAAAAASASAGQQAAILAAIAALDAHLTLINGGHQAAFTKLYTYHAATWRRQDLQAIRIGTYTLDQSGMDQLAQDVIDGVAEVNGGPFVVYNEPGYRGAENEVFPLFVLDPNYLAIVTPGEIGQKIFTPQLLLDVINGLYLGHP